MSRVFIDSFTAGLDELTSAQQIDHVAVLAMLKATGRFSVFEATANQRIAKTVTRIMTKGLIDIAPDGTRKEYGKLVEHKGGEYPWTYVKLTESGEQLLRDAALSTEAQPAH